jgi:branched-subunit amino acid transport protein AzlD
VFNLFAVIAAAAIAGVLFRWVYFAVFGTKVDFVVTTAAAGALPVCLSALGAFL